MIRRLFAGMAMAGFVVVLAPAPAAGQAKGSADASAAKRSDPHWKAPRNAWGQPDLEGIWTSDDMRGVPMSRPPQYGNRLYLSDEEFATRARQRGRARDVDNARTGTFRNEEGSRDFSYTSMVIEPSDGRVPALTPAALARRRPNDQGSFGLGPWEKVQDFSLYDRCITRGVVGSWMPAVYGNGARLIQTPDAVVIAYEMVHDTRVIPLDGRPHVSATIKQFMGDSRARYEGDTLVIESSNYTDRTNLGGARHSEGLRLVERFTRVDADMIDYEVHVEDPATYSAPWTMRMTVTRQPAYEIYEYGCHEGNNAMRNALSAERAYERAAAEAKEKGLPPPDRVFERVNGDDRAR